MLSKMRTVKSPSVSQAGPFGVTSSLTVHTHHPTGLSPWAGQSHSTAGSLTQWITVSCSGPMVGTGHHSKEVLCVAEQSPRDTVTVKGPGPSSAVRASRLPLSPVDHVADSWLPLTSRATVAVLQAPMGPSNVQSMGGNSVRAKEAVEVHPLAPAMRAVYRPGPAWLGAGVPAGRVHPVMVEPASGTALTKPVAPKQSCSGMADTTAVGRGRTSMSRVTVLPGQPPLSAVA